MEFYQNARHFTGDVLMCFLESLFIYIWTYDSSQFIHRGPIEKKPYAMVWCRAGENHCWSCLSWLSPGPNDPDSKFHVVNMGPTWVLSAPGGPHVGPINLAIRGANRYRWIAMVVLRNENCMTFGWIISSNHRDPWHQDHECVGFQRKLSKAFSRRQWNRHAYMFIQDCGRI